MCNKRFARRVCSITSELYNKGFAELVFIPLAQHTVAIYSVTQHWSGLDYEF